MDELSLMENKTAALQGLWGSIQLLMQKNADKNNEDKQSEVYAALKTQQALLCVLFWCLGKIPERFHSRQQ